MAGETGWRWWKKRLIDEDRWIDTIINAVGTIGIWFGLNDVFARFIRWLALDPMSQLRCYLWTSFLATLVVWPAWVVLFRSVRAGRAELVEAESRVEARDRALELQHRMIRMQHRIAEEVRRAAELRQGFDCRERLHAIGTELIAILRLRLGGEGYAVTVKHANVPEKKLDAIFRDGGQDLNKRKAWDSISLADSVVYQRFEQPGARQRVLIGDTDRVSDLKYRQRATACGYRSVIAFPLREPMILHENSGSEGPPSPAYANLIGFLAVDVPVVDGFDGLFNPLPPGAHRREDGEDLEPCQDVDFFYGLADALATILVLRRGSPVERVS